MHRIPSILLWLSLVLGACAYAPPLDPCMSCPGACYVVSDCEGPECSICVSVCGSDKDCPIGHHCIDGTKCSPFCDPVACLPDMTRYDCSGPCGSCQAVECGRHVPCSGEGKVCSTEEHRCFAADGTCAGDTDCPNYADVPRPAYLSPTCWPTDWGLRYGRVSCVQGKCSYGREFLKPSWGQESLSIDVLVPNERTRFLSVDEVRFEWSQVAGTASLAFIFTRVPGKADEIPKVAIWALAVPVDGSTSAIWPDGKAVVDGMWLEHAPILPTGPPLFFFVESVKEGKLIAQSAFIPFVVGDSWPNVGDACEEAESLPDSCDNPAAAPQVCYRGHCWRACSSDVDCAKGVSCGAPLAKDGRIRVCGG